MGRNRYLENLNDFAAVGDKMYVRVKGVDEEGRLSLSYEAREKDRPRPPNRRERRGAARGEGMLGHGVLGPGRCGRRGGGKDVEEWGWAVIPGLCVCVFLCVCVCSMVCVVLCGMCALFVVRERVVVCV